MFSSTTSQNDLSRHIEKRVCLGIIVKDLNALDGRIRQLSRDIIARTNAGPDIITLVDEVRISLQTATTLIQSVLTTEKQTVL